MCLTFSGFATQAVFLSVSQTLFLNVVIPSAPSRASNLQAFSRAMFRINVSGDNIVIIHTMSHSSDFADVML